MSSHLTGTGGQILIEIRGGEQRRIFGIEPAVRLKRQVAARAAALAGRKLVCDASCVLGDSTLDWLIQHPGHVVESSRGMSRAVVVDRNATIELHAAGAGKDLASQGLTLVPVAQLGETYSRKLRRRQQRFFRSLAEDPAPEVERALFRSVYKGVTDIVTHYVWPVPAFHVTRLCARLGISPNLVTACGIALTILTAVLFYRGAFVQGLVAGWLMTFLDTVDGKLARVTSTSSRFGDRLDHITDKVHPPAWWIAMAIGLVHTGSTGNLVQISCVVIIVTYLIGRACESAFKKRHGFNQYVWSPFDSVLRMVIVRRNIILLMLTAGAVLGQVDVAYQLAAVWSVLTILIQPVRFIQAHRAWQHGRVPVSWLQ